MRHIRFDRALALDLEMTCWAEGAPPEGRTPEIIQIGLAEADLRAGTITRSVSQLVRPADLRLSAYCTELTGLMAEDLKYRGLPLGQALNRLAKTWPLRTRPVFVWGDDVDALRREASAKGARGDLIADSHNLHALFRALAQAHPDGPPGSGSGISVPDALEMLGRAFEGRRHDAETDAVNTARILLALGQQVWRFRHSRDTTTSPL